jgi:hypothetical protein
MKTEISMGSLIIFGWDDSRLFHTMGTMLICCKISREISLVEDL